MRAAGPERASRSRSLMKEPASPLVALLPPSDPDKDPGAPELLALENELEIPFAVSLARIADGLPGAAVPHEHRAPAVFAFRYRSLEVPVFQWVILDVHGEALVTRVEARPFGTAQLLRLPSSSSRKS